MYVAVDCGKSRDLLSRTRQVNGELAEEMYEVVRPSVFKDYSTGVTREDLVEFIEWLTESTVSVVSGRERLQRKLQNLKLLRYAYFHVFCEDGRVPVEKSMLRFSRRFGVNQIVSPFCRNDGKCEEVGNTSDTGGPHVWQRWRQPLESSEVRGWVCTAVQCPEEAGPVDQTGAVSTASVVVVD